MDPTTLLLDGDTLAFIAAAACQGTVESPEGYVTPFARRVDGEAIVDRMVQRLHDQLEASHIKVFLSCPSEDNWRLSVDAAYKSNRKDSVRPLILQELKDYLRLKYGAIHLAGLEADDCIGIYMTSKTLIEGNKVAVGKDKDFKTIPGMHHQLTEDVGIVNYINAYEASLWHYQQALSGDAVDGYEGCPGIGSIRARKIVEKPTKLVPKAGVITRGKNKGKKITKWHEAGPCSVWEAVVCQFEKAGLTEKHALKAARLARILHADEYDMETRTVKLWVPGKE